MSGATGTTITSGIEPLDARVGGLESGGTYLVVGNPGPAKMVAALQFLADGVAGGDRCLLVTNVAVEDIFGVARAWGFELEDAWSEGLLQILGFRDDFELRAIRSIEPDEVLEELDELIVGAPARVAVDPGSMFLTGGARTLLGSAFVAWARGFPATVLATFSVDGDASALPSSADWLLSATTGRLVLERRSEGLYQVTVVSSLPELGERAETVSLELKPGAGLVTPDRYPARRGADRGQLDANRLLLVSLGQSLASDLETWAGQAFDTDIVTEPFEAVTKVQADADFGCVLVHAPRRRVREGIQACRAIRPLTRAAIVFASDDAIRSTDRVHLLEAGADDCLSGGLDFRELGLRIKQSIATGARPAVDRSDVASAAGVEAHDTNGGRMTRERFGAEIERRAADPVAAFFCLLDVTSAGMSATDLEDELAELVRSDEGDLVSGGPDRCLVLLQGAREGQLGPLLERLRARLAERAGEGAGPTVEVLSHPADAQQIRSLVESSDGQAR